MLFKVIIITVICHLGVNFVFAQQCEVAASSRSSQPTCEFPNPPDYNKEMDPGNICQCEEGSVILNYENTTCVPSEQCPSECSHPNLFWNDCGSKCPKTCGKPNPQVCLKICQWGCFCKEGLILNEANMECIAPENCPNPDEDNTSENI